MLLLPAWILDTFRAIPPLADITSPMSDFRIQGVVLEAQACQAEAQSEKNSWLLKIGNFSWQSQGLAVATGAKSFCNA